jgi:DNA-binding transcriptional LysR family regulator
MDRFEEMATFVAIIEEGSLAAAARRLGRSAPAVTRILGGLEQRLGVRLIQRTTRRLAATEAGERFFAACQRLLAEVAEIEQAAAGAGVPSGRLRITAPSLFGRLHVVPVVNAFMSRFADVQVELMLVDRVVDLVEEGIDVAVRIGHLPDSSLTQRRVGLVRRVLCASPAYLKRAGTPQKPHDLAHHDLLAFSGIGALRAWRFRSGGRSITVPIKPRLIVNQADAAIAAALDGRGITLVLSYQVAEFVRARRLVELLHAFAPESQAVQLVYPGHRLMAPSVRAFLDAAVAGLTRRIEQYDVK